MNTLQRSGWFVSRGSYSGRVRQAHSRQHVLGRDVVYTEDGATGGSGEGL